MVFYFFPTFLSLATTLHTLNVTLLEKRDLHFKAIPVVVVLVAAVLFRFLAITCRRVNVNQSTSSLPGSVAQLALSPYWNFY